MIKPYIHLIVGITICSRIADVWTTYLVTPNLKLEANVIAKRLGWKYAFLTILVGLVPYLWPPLGIIISTTSFMVAASNASKIVMAKALGEEEFSALTHRIILATPPWPGLLYLVMPAFFVGVVGCLLLLLYSKESEWGYYFGIGMLAYAMAILVWYPINYFRIRGKS